jgi:hypothetical protein
VPAWCTVQLGSTARRAANTGRGPALQGDLQNKGQSVSSVFNAKRDARTRRRGATKSDSKCRRYNCTTEVAVEMDLNNMAD